MENAEQRPQVGVSACLLGALVRFDGGHTRDRFVAEGLSAHVDLVSLCPEMEAGFGAPRPAMRLVRPSGNAGEARDAGDAGDARDAAGRALRLLTTNTAQDVTAQLAQATERRLTDGSLDGLCGFVLKKNSPSCGPFRVKTYLDNGQGAPPEAGNVGLFAAALRERFPHLPIEDEGRLNDPGLRESFLLRVFAWQRYRALCAGGLTRRRLREFHARSKMLLHAHGPAPTRALGRLVASPDDSPAAVARDAEAYAQEMMRILSAPATRGRHVDTLQHLAGHLSDELAPGARSELHGLIEEYRQGWVALETPMALLRHHLRALGTAWANAQLYLDPHPRPLGLRSVVR